MTDNSSLRGDLARVAQRLGERREAILGAWREAVEADAMLVTNASLPRRQLDDHIPALLQSFEQHLRSYGGPSETSAEDAEQLKASQHGQERWQQGFRLVEVVREWRHLQLALHDELGRLLHDASDEATETARRLLMILCIDGLAESAERYEAMERREAQRRLSDLESALSGYEQLERQRAEAWREAAHDLRGNLGVVKTATAVLNTGGVSDTTRTKSLDILHRGVESMHELLNELISLARLEAGREVREIREFDIAELCIQLCEGMTQMAERRGLKLTYSGPDSLVVASDPMKIRRIAQNLLVNALTYTARGSVRIVIDASAEHSWQLEVEDTGPGVPAAVAGAVIEGPERQKAMILNGPGAGSAANNGPSGSGSAAGGEGIGLSIVRRLCDLLDARLSLRSPEAGGSVFCVTFPRTYPR
jgi:signal transduction histidine kinase